MTGIPFHRDRWTPLGGQLAIGGHYHGLGCFVWDTVVGAEFDLVLSLHTCHNHDHGPAAGVEHHSARIPDGILDPAELDTVRRFAGHGVDAIRAGCTVLARCHAGYNRSALLAAFILLKLGYTADDAIALIRERRGPYALCNPEFVRLIHAEYDTLHGEDWRETPAASEVP